MSADARVVDVRYGRYEGERRGGLSAVWSLARWSALTALGARRGWKAKLLPTLLVAIAFIPAFVVLGLRALAGPELTDRLPDLLPYPRYFLEIGLDVLIFAGMVTPELLCPDRRDRVLSLYFSTALGRGQYVAGKLLAAILPLCLLTVLPVLTLFAGNVVFADHPLGYLQEHWGDVPRIVAAGVLIAVYFGSFGLAIASLTARRAFAMGGYVGLVVLGAAGSGFLVFAVDAGKLGHLVHLARVPLVAARGIFSAQDAYTGGVALVWWYAVCALVVGLSLAVLAFRYRGGSEG